MGRGVLEVLLVDAKGLAGNDFLGEPVELPPRMFLFRLRFAHLFLPVLAGKLDPYVVVQYRSQERKSSTARGS
jgi:hypothetical protein